MTESRPRFDPVSRRTIAEEIREVLLRSIRNGELLPGTPLPAERDLASEFGVARTSVREAVQGLAGLGAVERRGNRFCITERLPDIDVNVPDTRKRRVEQLFEVRRILEVPLAALSARRAREADLKEICAVADRFDVEMPLAEFRALDREFHWTVARACGNDLLVELYGKLLDSLFRSYEFESLLSANGNRSSVRHLIESATLGHRAIAKAFAEGDEETVTAAVAGHLQAVETEMVSRMV
jgi:GntR family transcriptional repressor for pyruvate dehydrogenase complex